MTVCTERRPDLLPAGSSRAACWLHDAATMASPAAAPLLKGAA